MMKTLPVKQPVKQPVAAFQFEMPDGEAFHVESYVRRLLRSQDLNAWRNDPAGFDAWIKKCVSEAIGNTTATLWFPKGTR